jgi:hypothetical protein
MSFGLEQEEITLYPTSEYPIRKEACKFMQNYDVKVKKENLEAVLIVLPIKDYDLILGMISWPGMELGWIV